MCGGKVIKLFIKTGFTDHNMLYAIVFSHSIWGIKLYGTEFNGSMKTVFSTLIPSFKNLYL